MRAQFACFRQRARVAAVGLHSPAPRRVHGGEVRVGDDHFVPERLQAARHPLALGRRLDQHLRSRAPAEYRGEAVRLRPDAALDDLARSVQDAELAFHLVYVDANMLHGWPPPLRHTTAFTIVGLRPPRAVAASRFIPYFGSTGPSGRTTWAAH